MFSRFSYIFGVFRLFSVFLTFSLLCHSSYTFTENNGSIYSPTEQATGDTGSINLPKSDAYAEEIKYFKNCVLSGQFPDKVKAEELRTVVGLLNEF